MKVTFRISLRLVGAFTNFLICADGMATAHSGMRVAMVQMDIVDGNLMENKTRAEEGIREAAGYNVDFVCLPEVADFSTWVCGKGG